MRSVYSKAYKLIYNEDKSVSLKLVTTYTDGSKRYDDVNLNNLPSSFDILMEIRKMEEALIDNELVN